MTGAASDSFGARLRSFRTSAGLSIGELAKRIDYSKTYLSKIENDLKSPSLMLAMSCDASLGTGGALADLVDDMHGDEDPRRIVMDRSREPDERLRVLDQWAVGADRGADNLEKSPENADDVVASGSVQHRRDSVEPLWYQAGQLVAELRALWTRANRPSLQDMAVRANVPPARLEFLFHPHPVIPDWLEVEALLRATGEDPARLPLWKQRWVRVLRFAEMRDTGIPDHGLLEWHKLIERKEPAARLRSQTLFSPDHKTPDIVPVLPTARPPGPLSTALTAGDRATFVAQLEALRNARGVSFGRIGKLSHHRLPRSTANWMVRPGNFPAHASQVREFVAACGETEAEISLWERAFERAKTLRNRSAATPDATTPVGTGTSTPRDNAQYLEQLADDNVAQETVGRSAMAAVLVNELKVLRKGRGLYASRIADRVGPAIRVVSGVAAHDAPGVIRRKVTDWLVQLADTLPTDLHTALRAAFAISPEVRLPIYQDRVEWTATHLDRDPRTVRRRIDEAIDHVAQLAMAGTLPPRVTTAETGWHTAELRMMLVLDRERPEAVEQRRIVSDQDDLTKLDLEVTRAVGSSDPEFEVDVFYGGTLADRGMESSEHRAFALELPRPLARGESHDFAVRYRLSGEEAMRPRVVCVPKRPCTLFDLRVRFDRARLPSRLWMLRGVFQRDISDPVRRGDMLEVNGAGEIHLAFYDLTPGLAYGVRWDPSPPS